MIDFGCCKYVESRPKANRLSLAVIGAGLANYAAFRETPVLHPQVQLPGRLHVAAENRLRARVHAVATKSALATLKIDLWIATGAADNNALGAGGDAFATSGTTIGEQRLSNGSGWSDRPRG